MSFLKAKRIDATQGSILNGVVLYALPIMLAMLVQRMFHAADLVVLGQVADSTSIAAVGVTGSVVSLLTSAFVGLASGARVALAHKIGAADREAVKSNVDTSIIISLIAGVAVAVAGVIFVPDLLRLTNCPAECFDGAVIYARIYVCSAPFILLYNTCSNVLITSGNTKSSLYYIIIGGIVNVILNVILCFVLKEKVAAVAIATFSSQMISALLVFIHLTRDDSICRLNVREIKFDFPAFKTILRYGLPLLLTYVITPLSGMQVQAAINSFGVSVAAGNSAAATVEGIATTLVSPYASTAGTYISQNIGANNRERVKQSFTVCMALTVVSGLILGIATYFTGEFWIGLIVGDDTAAITFAQARMILTSALLVIPCIGNVISCSLQAYGYVSISSVNTILFGVVFKIAWIYLVWPNFSDLAPIKSYFMLVLCFVISPLFQIIVESFALIRARKKYINGTGPVI